MNRHFFTTVFQAAFETLLVFFVVLLALDQLLPHFATLSLRLDILGIFMVFCGVVFFLLQFKRSPKY